MHHVRIKPNSGHVLIQHCVTTDFERKSDGGIIMPALPANKVDSMQRAVVLAAADDTPFKQGDYVYAHIHAGAPIEGMQLALSSKKQGVIRIIKATEIPCSATVEKKKSDDLDVIEAMDTEDAITLKSSKIKTISPILKP